jgi:hypothetical protein
MDPIAVDVPVKAPATTAPAARPPAPKADVKAAVATAAAVAVGAPPGAGPVAAQAAGTLTTWLGKVGRLVGIEPTKRQAVVMGVAACSLAAGIGTVRLVWPGAPTPTPAKPLVADAGTHTPAPAPAPETITIAPTALPAAPAENTIKSPNDPPPGVAPWTVPAKEPVKDAAKEPPPIGRGPTLSVEAPVPPAFDIVPSSAPVAPATSKPPLPATLPAPDVLPVIPVTPAAGVAPPAAPDQFKAAVAADVKTPPPLLPAPSGGVAPTLPIPSVDVGPPVIPAGASEPMKSGLPPVPPVSPAATPPGGAVPLPPLPAAGPTTPAVPVAPPVGPAGAPPATPVSLPKADPPAVAPKTEPKADPFRAPKVDPLAPAKPDLPAVPPVAPLTPPAPVTPPPVAGKPVDGLPVTPLPMTPAAPPPVTPVAPAPPPVGGMTPPAPPAGVAPLAPPAALPMGVDPTPPAPAAKTDTPGATKIEYVKPAGDPKPTGVAERTPQTSFDVDLYEPKAGDSYETVAREFYNDARYGRALAEYNRRKALQNSGPLEVPPIHVLRKRFPQLVGGTTPVGTTTAATPGEWGPAGSAAGDPAPAFRPSGGRTFTVPPGGMSMRAVSRVTLGTETRWKEIYDLNPQFPPDALTAGTELKLPADAAVPK